MAPAFGAPARHVGRCGHCETMSPLSGATAPMTSCWPPSRAGSSRSMRESATLPAATRSSTDGSATRWAAPPV
eukprot:12158416-Alexandrium_andersonii.AAC.1